MKKIAAGGVIIALLIGGYAGASAYKARKTAPPESGYTPKEYIALSALNREDPGVVELPLAGVRLERTGDLWSANPPLPGPLNQTEVSGLFRSLAGLQAERIIEENPPDLSRYGLDPPSGRVILQTGAGETAEFLGGAMTPSRTGYYVMRAGDPKVYLVSVYLGSGIFADTFRIREKAVSRSFTLPDVQRFLLESDSVRIDIRAKPEDAPLLAPFSTHIMTSPYKAVRGVAGEAFEDLLKGFQYLTVQAFADPSPADLAQYGLDKPLRAYIETNDQKIDLLLGKRENGLQYAQRQGQTEVFTLNEIQPLIGLSPFSLTDKFALIVNIDRVDSVTVSGIRGTLTGEIRRQNGETAYFFNGRAAEEKSFKNWYQKVIGVLADAELPEGPQPAGTPETVISYRLNNPAGTEAAIGFIPYDRGFYALAAEGIAEFLVSRSQISAMYDTPVDDRE
ncbi:MAG: DUF4340 domain-containing protein [Spirochaetaceae bacterium]|nr:DUF4340 domain-containing protein [Spirochaetaceae bacterium]